MLVRLKGLTSEGFFGNFEYYHVRKLLEIKLDALYKGKVKEDSEDHDE